MLVIALLAASGIAGDNNAIDAKVAFSKLKTLAGNWEGTGKAGKEQLSYEPIAAGTSLIERETAENRPVMVTVYHIDGNRLLLTHYCMAGNQPRMQATTFDAKTGRLRFEFIDGTNLPNKDAGHMHNVSLRFVDEQHLTSQWEYYEGGRPKMTEAFEFTRVR
jgi:hypothetical protein